MAFSLCLSNSPTAAEASKYKQLNGSSDDDDVDDEHDEFDEVGEGDDASSEVAAWLLAFDIDMCEVENVFVFGFVCWVSQLTTDWAVLFELHEPGPEPNKSIDDL